MVTPQQCRAARGLLGWNQQELAQKAGVGIVTVHQFETGLSKPRRATLDVIKRALESAAVEFIDENGGGPGVRLRKRQPKNLKARVGRVSPHICFGSERRHRPQAAKEAV